MAAPSVTGGEWAAFNDVRAAMAEEERELSTDEEDVVPPDRDVLLQAAADRMKREGGSSLNPVQVGVHSAEFNERASSVFGGLGGAHGQEGVTLRFWTSVYSAGSERAPAGARVDASEEDGDEAGAEEQWRPMDDLDALDDASEEDLSQLEEDESDEGGPNERAPAARKRTEPMRTLPADTDEQHAHKKRLARPSVKFGANTIITLPEEPSPEGMAVDCVERAAPRGDAGTAPAAAKERPGYRHYSLADVDADAGGANSRAMREAMDAVRAQQGDQER